MQIYDSLGASPLVPEKNTEPSMVMTAGYTPDDLRIKELLNAGKRLEAFKLGENFVEADYDFGADEEVPDNYDSYDDYMDELEAQELYNQTMRRVQASFDEREQQYSRRLREEKEQAKEQAKEVSEAPTKEGE